MFSSTKKIIESLLTRYVEWLESGMEAHYTRDYVFVIVSESLNSYSFLIGDLATRSSYPLNRQSYEFVLLFLRILHVWAHYENNNAITFPLGRSWQHKEENICPQKYFSVLLVDEKSFFFVTHRKRQNIASYVRKVEFHEDEPSAVVEEVKEILKIVERRKRKRSEVKKQGPKEERPHIEDEKSLWPRASFCCRGESSGEWSKIRLEM